MIEQIAISLDALSTLCDSNKYVVQHTWQVAISKMKTYFVRFGDIDILKMITTIACVPSFEISQSNSDAIWYAVTIKVIFYFINSSSKVS